MRLYLKVIFVVWLLTVPARLIGNDPQAEAKGLRIVIDAGFIPTAEKDVAILQGNVVLENRSGKSIAVVTGTALGPRIGSEHVWYGVQLQKTKTGSTLKPSPGSLDQVELAPGESTSLRPFRIECRKGIGIRVFYDVAADLKLYYPQIWTGSLEVKIRSGD